MWTGRKQTLPSVRRPSALLKKPKYPQKPSAWQRFSIRNPQHFDDEILASGLGIHSDFMIPTEPRAGGMVRLDALRGLNMGHINVRYHQDYFHPSRRPSQAELEAYEEAPKVPVFALKQVLKAARSSLQPIKVRLHRTPKQGRRSTSAGGDLRSEFDPRGSTKGGFFTVEQGIGTARGSSPTYKKQWAAEDDEDEEDDTDQNSLMKSAGIRSSQRETPAQRLLITTIHQLTEPQVEATSPVGKRLNYRSGKLRLWRDNVNPKAAKVLKPVPFQGVAAAAQRVMLEYTLGPVATADAKIWPISNFLRMAPTKELRTPERISPEQQKLDLEKGLGVGARTQTLDFATRAESFRRQVDPAKYKDEARCYLCKGILHDNAQEFTRAVESYKKYADLCGRMEDVEGESLAYNSIGCSIQEKENLKVAALKSEFEHNQIPDTSIIEYERALEYHKHAAEKSSIEGQFICYTNIGLLCTTLSMWAKAANSHKNALKCATVLENPRGQCAAVGNLAFLLYRRKKFDVARSCMTRYLQICKVVNFIPGIARAHFYLGDMATQYQRYKEALQEFEDALAAAEEYDDRQIQNLCKAQIGICKGSLALAELQNSVEAQSIFDNDE